MAIFLSILVFPLSVYAYSDKIVLGGQNIGISIENNSVIVIGFYKIDGKYNKGDNELKVGDQIIGVNDKKITSIKELTEEIEKNTSSLNVKLTFIRNKKEQTTNLKLFKQNDTYKTGLYVKDNIKGIGTISYIDPETKIYGALGHEILEGTSNTKIEIKKGYIFESGVVGINKSIDGSPGQKKATFNVDNVLGTLDKNTIYGIFGKYENDIDTTNLIEVGTKDDVKIGNASIYTVLNNNEIEKFDIEIDNISQTNKIKNISFKITDEKLLEKTGGIVQGMSGSPIVQNNKVVGVVTHVIIDNVKSGYGIFITTMLNEGEKSN